jgi:monoterpene epsilon-lactone hydrolase
MASQEKYDHIMSPKCLPEFVKLYLGDTDTHNPLASPVFGNYTGIPPLLIQVGGYDIIRDDSIKVAAKVHADGVDVTLEV